jgi:hypothetical protein
MRRLLGSALPAFLLAGVLTACGDDDSGGVAQDPAPTSPTSSSTVSTATPTDGTVDFELVTTFTETEAGGQVSQVAVPFAAGDDVEAFTAQFESDAMKARVQQEAEKVDVPDGMALYGAVIAIGCDAPDKVAVTRTDAGLVITALKVASPMLECFAPMTTVALVLVPSSAVS